MDAEPKPTVDTYAAEAYRILIIMIKALLGQESPATLPFMGRKAGEEPVGQKAKEEAAAIEDFCAMIEERRRLPDMSLIREFDRGCGVKCSRLCSSWLKKAILVRKDGGRARAQAISVLWTGAQRGAPGTPRRSMVMSSAAASSQPETNAIDRPVADHYDGHYYDGVSFADHPGRGSVVQT